ncbi:MAG: hypothetical protein ACI4MB_06135 [Candidatus Coproplasma sp.]
MARSLIDRLVYRITQKPTHYKEVKNPPKTIIGKLLRAQDARQVQYNNWSKAHKVYSGSYLPKEGKKLEKQGWVNENGNIMKNNKPNNSTTFYRRKSTNQWVRNDTAKNDSHWHWYNWWKKDRLPKNFMRSKKDGLVYLDKYGNPCARKSKESHIEGK